MSPRQYKRYKDLGDKFSVQSLLEIIDNPEESLDAYVLCGFHYNNKADASCNNLWIGSFPDNKDLAYSLMIANSDGSPKREEDITRVGNDVYNRNKYGHARLSVNQGDILIVGIYENDLHKTAFFRVVGFSKADIPNRNILALETLKIEICDDTGLSKIYTHDSNNMYLGNISEKTQEELLEKSKINTISHAKWSDMNLERLSYLEEPIECKLKFEETGSIVIDEELKTLYSNIHKLCKNYHIEAKLHDDVKDITFFFGRTPVKISYFVSLTETVPAVVVTIVAPYVDKLLFVVNEENFFKLGNEPLLTFRVDNFNEFYNIVKEEMRENEGPLTLDRIFRL